MAEDTKKKDDSDLNELLESIESIMNVLVEKSLKEYEGEHDSQLESFEQFSNKTRAKVEESMSDYSKKIGKGYKVLLEEVTGKKLGSDDKKKDNGGDINPQQMNTQFRV